MMNPKKGFMKVAIGGMESTLGTAVPRTERLPITDFGYLIEKPTKASKDIITGRNSNAGYDVNAIDYSAEIPTNLIANKATGLMLQSLVGVASSPVTVGCGIRVTYSGAEPSCKLVVSGAGKTITAYIGNLGEEILDTNFGSAGVLDLTGKTLATVVSTIAGYTGYEAVSLYGDSSSQAVTPVDITTAQAKGRSVPIHFTGTGTGVVLKVFKPDYTNAEHAGFSIQVDGDGDNRLGAGAIVDSATISADLKAKAKATWSLQLLSVIAGQSAIVLGLKQSDLDVMKFSDAETLIAGLKFCYVKNTSVTIANNHSADEGYCQGSLTKAKHVRGQFDVTGSVTLTVGDVGDSPSSETERLKNLSNETSSLQLLYTGRTLAAGIKAMMLIDMPNIQYSDDSKSSGDSSLEQSLSFEAIDALSYDDHLQIQMLCEAE
jgi:hypothetical protein